VDCLVRVESLAVPLLIDDIDTDVITPMQRILEGLPSMVEHAFEALRFGADGTPNPASPLNDPRYAGAEILITGRNFGCGSSRETAVWAIKGLGVRCIVAPSFGDIFRSNCFKNGLLPVTLPDADVAALADEARLACRRFVVDLDTCRIMAPSGRAFAFAVSPLRREALLEGLDDLALMLRRDDALRALGHTDRTRRPWVYLGRH